MRDKTFILADDLAWETTDPGVKRKILGYDDHLMLVSVQFEKGAIGPLHHHPHRQVSYVESGTFEVNIGGEKRKLKKGDSFFVASDIEHGVTALEAGCLLDVFTPYRADFL